MKFPKFPRLPGIPFPNGSAKRGSWLGTKKSFVLLCPIGEQQISGHFRVFLYTFTVVSPLLVWLVYKGTLSLTFLSRDETTEWSIGKSFWMLEKTVFQFVSNSRYGIYYHLRTREDIVLFSCFMYPLASWWDTLNRIFSVFLITFSKI